MTGRGAGVAQLKSLVSTETAASASAQPFAEEVLERLARAGRFRDEETAEHVERMSRSCALIARQLGWDAAGSSTLRAASAMHDVGKVGVPDSVLRKPGKLTAEERVLVEAHPQIGHDILAGSGDEALELAARVALTHHERFDGSGYPRGLEGEAIPPEGRIAAVADVFDALTHDRIYRAAFSVPEALEMLRDGSGSQFDPQVLTAFEATLPELEQVRLLYPDSPDRREEPALFVGPERPTRVLIVEDHEAISRGLELVLRREGFEIAGTGRSLADGAWLLERRGADVLVLDISLEGDDGLELVPAAKERGTKVLLYTGSTEPATITAARAAGADGVAAKAGSPAEFVEAVRAVARNESFIDPRLPAPTPAEQGEKGLLTAREREVVGLIAEGLSGEDVALRLFLSPATVRTHLRNAMDRSGAKTRAHLVALAASRGEISIE